MLGEQAKRNLSFSLQPNLVYLLLDISCTAMAIPQPRYKGSMHCVVVINFDCVTGVGQKCLLRSIVPFINLYIPYFPLMKCPLTFMVLTPGEKAIFTSTLPLLPSQQVSL